MSDITAVVLTMGEETTQDAIDSLKIQTVAPSEIIVINDIAPFHKALNLGVSRVKTEFFIQVDSDMILDKNCLEDLRKCMQENIGIVVGHLKDELVGRVVSPKMFRRKCFEKYQFKDSISPDTDFREDILKDGWKILYALSFRNKNKKLWHTFGEHKPTYTPLYTYSKYILEGRRYKHRRDLASLIWHFKKLHDSSHGSSLIAQIAMAHGDFLEEDRDLLKPYLKDSDFSFLEGFLESKSSCSKKLDSLFFSISKPEKIFRKFYKLGIDLRKHNSFVGFKHYLNNLSKSNDSFAWIAKIGLCHGLFFKNFCRRKFKKDYALLEELIPNYDSAFSFKKWLKKFLSLKSK